MVSKQIRHKFEDDNTIWYEGEVVGYCSQTKMHEVQYLGDDSSYHFDLVIAILNGDLVRVV